MNLDNLKYKLRFSKEALPTLLVGFAVIWAVLVMVKVTGFFIASARAEKVIEGAIEKSKPNDEIVKGSISRANKIAEDLKKSNLFSPPPPKQHPVKEVFAIFGDEVLINDKWYKVGDRVGEAKIIAIGPTSVTTVWDGKEKVFYPIQATLVEATKTGRGSSSNSERKDENASKENGSETATVRVEGERRPPFGGRPGGPGMDFAGMRERFANMSEAERDRFRAEMRERAERFGFGGRGGPGGDRGRSFGGRR